MWAIWGFYGREVLFTVFRVVMTCNVLCKYQIFRDKCCYHH